MLCCHVCGLEFRGGNEIQSFIVKNENQKPYKYLKDFAYMKFIHTRCFDKLIRFPNNDIVYYQFQKLFYAEEIVLYDVADMLNFDALVLSDKKISFSQAFNVLLRYLEMVSNERDDFHIDWNFFLQKLDLICGVYKIFPEAMMVALLGVINSTFKYREPIKILCDSITNDFKEFAFLILSFIQQRSEPMIKPLWKHFSNLAFSKTNVISHSDEIEYLNITLEILSQGKEAESFMKKFEVSVKNLMALKAKMTTEDYSAFKTLLIRSLDVFPERIQLFKSKNLSEWTMFDQAELFRLGQSLIRTSKITRKLIYQLVKSIFDDESKAIIICDAIRSPSQKTFGIDALEKYFSDSLAIKCIQIMCAFDDAIEFLKKYTKKVSEFQLKDVEIMFEKSIETNSRAVFDFLILKFQNLISNEFLISLLMMTIKYQNDTTLSQILHQFPNIQPAELFFEFLMSPENLAYISSDTFRYLRKFVVCQNLSEKLDKYMRNFDVYLKKKQTQIPSFPAATIWNQRLDDLNGFIKPEVMNELRKIHQFE